METGGTVLKAEFARLTGRTPGRVSQWIAAGKIHGPALVRTKDGEKIDVAVALAQLGRNLDPSQQIGQAVPLLAASEQEDEPPVAPSPRAPAVASDDQRRLLKAKADDAESRAKKGRIELLAQNGARARIAEIEPAWRRGIGELIGRIEAALPELAERLAGESDPKAAIVAAKQWWRSFRAKLAGEAAARADSLPASAPASELDDAPDDPAAA